MGIGMFAWLLMAQMYYVGFFVFVIRWTLWKYSLTLAWQNCKRQLRKAFGYRQ
jgi:hypothetical protein